MAKVPCVSRPVAGRLGVYAEHHVWQVLHRRSQRGATGSYDYHTRFFCPFCLSQRVVRDTPEDGRAQ